MVIFDRLAESYTTAPNRDFYHSLIRPILQPMKNSYAGHALDLACGSGFSTEIGKELFPHLKWTGLDCSEKMLELAQSNPLLQSVDWRSATSEALPFPDGYFNFILCNYGFHWFGTAAVRELFRVAAPGGQAILTLPVTPPRGVLGSVGNTLLKSRLWKYRREIAEVRDRLPFAAGIRKNRLRPLFGHLARVEIRSFTESFGSVQEFASGLLSRGSLNAVFGSAALKVYEEISQEKLFSGNGVDFTWHYAVVQLSF